jgi:hypothetical protein
MCSLIVSPLAPTVSEIKENIMVCYSGATATGEDLSLSTGGPLGKPCVVHQVLMFDELAVE